MFRPNRRRFLAGATAALGASLPNRHMLAAGAPSLASASTHPLLLWYRAPAKQWVDALPIGNGSLGAMVFGGGEDASPVREFLQLNDDTLWSGYPKDGNNLDAPNHLADVRRAVLNQKDYHLADQLVKKMQGLFAEAYQPLGNLRIDFTHDGPITNYRRELDLHEACVTTTYTVGQTHFMRQAIASNPDQVIALHITASRPGQLHATITLDGAMQLATKALNSHELLLTGKASSHVAGAGHPGSEAPIRSSNVVGEGMYFAASVQLINEGGAVTASDNALTVHSANSFSLLITSATGFRGFRSMPDVPLEAVVAHARQKLAAVRTKPFSILRDRQRLDYQSLFRRVELDLGPADTATPTDERIANFVQTPDPALVALYFQFGRYLLIGSSRPGSQPANLQGLWNEKTQPPWGSNWTSNINIEMNYWHAETCNLSECALPLFDLIEGLSTTGMVTARETYNLPGWAVHHNVDIWCTSNPVGMGVGSPTWANWGMAGPWLCSHLYEHFRFTGDIDFLRNKAWPLMKGCATFCLAWLIEDGAGHLTTCPSESTENDFLAPNGKPAMTSAGCTMDMALIRELFANCNAIAAILKIEDPIVAGMQAALPRLVPYQIGKYGQLQEWSIDFEENTPGQRHMSHLYPLYPGSQITQRNTPELAKAARTSLERRLANGGAYTGWSRAWAICFWARLLDGDKAYESISMLLQHSTNQALLDTHPSGKSFVFQIDGNFGATAGIAELLLQSHTDSIDLLPSLPGAWPSGKVSGLRARGGLLVNLEWSDGHATSCTLKSDRGGSYNLRAPKGQTIAAIKLSTKSLPFTLQADSSVKVELLPGKPHRLSFTAV